MADETPAPTPPTETTAAPESSELNQLAEEVVKHDSKPTMAVKVYAPFQVFYEGDAYSVSAINATGPFDVLPHHHNFLCTLVPCELTIQSAEGTKTVKINHALMHVKADRVVVFVDV